MKLSCDEATKLCDKSQYDEITFLEKMKLNFHLFLCKKCGLYSKQNKIMTKCYHDFKPAEKTATLSSEEKAAMTNELKEKL
jgi:hypothetical protein